MREPLILLLATVFSISTAQMMLPSVQVKITDTPFQVSNAQQLNTIKWTMLGTSTKEVIYCVSEAPVSQLRFHCVDCVEKNITDMVKVLSSAQDLTRNAGFPTVALKNVAANANWTGATIMCQAVVNGGTVDSQQATVDVQYLRAPHIVDASGQGPALIANQGYRFYVECVRDSNGQCQNGRRKTLKCSVQAHPPAVQYRWLKNGQPTSGNGAEITIGTEMIGQSLQCQANNGLVSDLEMLTSQAVQIDPYTSATLLRDNFAVVQSTSPFQGGNRIEMNQQVNLACLVEGNPRPVVFWKMRKANGQIVDAACPQGFDGQYQEISSDRERPVPPNVVRLNAICPLRISNYSFTGQYWCAACSYVSQGSPECSPGLDAPGPNPLNVQVMGPPMQSDTPPTIEQNPQSNNAVVTVHYCAEPTPRPPRDVVFTVDQNDLQVGQSWENFRFESTTQNNTVPNCFIARLQILPVREQDQYRQINLKLQNQFGSKMIPVSLEALLGGGSTATGRMSGWLIALLVALGVLVILIFACAVCLKRKQLCFKADKDDDSFNEPKAKANLNVRDNFYDVDAPRPPPFHSLGEVSEPPYNVYMSREAVV